MTSKALLFVGIILAAFAGGGACSSGDTGGSTNTGGTNTGGGGNGGGGSGTGSTTDTTTNTGPSCHECACVNLLSAGGCKDKCDKDFNGNPSTPNFCNGVAALTQCAQCLQDSCGLTTAEAADPSSCN